MTEANTGVAIYMLTTKRRYATPTKKANKHKKY